MSLGACGPTPWIMVFYIYRKTQEGRSLSLFFSHPFLNRLSTSGWDSTFKDILPQPGGRNQQAIRGEGEENKDPVQDEEGGREWEKEMTSSPCVPESKLVEGSASLLFHSPPSKSSGQGTNLPLGKPSCLRASHQQWIHSDFPLINRSTVDDECSREGFLQRHSGPPFGSQHEDQMTNP